MSTSGWDISSMTHQLNSIPIPAQPKMLTIKMDDEI